MDLVKMSVNLPQSVVDDLRAIAAERQITLTQAIKDAIAMEKYVTDERRDGSHLLVQKPDKTVREVVLLR